MIIKPLSPYLRAIDYLISPLMRLISLAPFEKPQESHGWHAQKLSETEINSLDLQKCVVIKGDDTSHIKNGSGPLFHIPLIGGWRNYAFLQTESGGKDWHIGWIVRDSKDQSIIRSEIHKLPLFDQYVRMLIGTPERITTFFAFNKNGDQINLTLIAKGELGDGSVYKNIRLF